MVFRKTFKRALTRWVCYDNVKLRQVDTEPFYRMMFAVNDDLELAVYSRNAVFVSRKVSNGIATTSDLAAMLKIIHDFIRIRTNVCQCLDAYDYGLITHRMTNNCSVTTHLMHIKLSTRPYIVRVESRLCSVVKVEESG
jgi:hypothetical protein